MRYKITTYHGEGDTVFNVVDADAPEGEQPAVVASYSQRKLGKQAHKAAVMCRDVKNGQFAEQAQ